MNKTILTVSISIAMTLAVTTVAWGAVPEGYYDSLEGKSGVELKKAVKALVADHIVISYGGEATDENVNTWSVFAFSDSREINGFRCWWDMYSANNMRVLDGHPGLNIEHSVANSWWGGKSGSKEAYCDLHHLNPSDAEANGQKSNWPPGEVSSVYWSNKVTTVGTPQAGQGASATRVFEPYSSYKGDFARAYFYIFTVYDEIPWKDEYAWIYDISSDLTLVPWAYDMLLAWSAMDPVSTKETTRNEAIYGFQKNRNPFIDCPELAEHIWGKKQNDPFHYELYTPVEDDPESYPGWDEQPIEMIAGQWEPVTDQQDITSDEAYYIVSPTKNRAMTSTLISTGKAIAECKTSPFHELHTYPQVLTAVPADIATVKLEEGNGGWYVGLYRDDEFAGYISVTTEKSAGISSSKTEGTLAKIIADKDRTRIIYNVKGTDVTLQYNASNPRFAAYTSNQAPIQLYRATEQQLQDPEPSDEPEDGDSPSENNPNDNAVDEISADDTIYGIFDINGRRVNASTTMGLDRGFYIVVSSYGTRKVRK